MCWGRMGLNMPWPCCSARVEVGRVANALCQMECCSSSLQGSLGLALGLGLRGPLAWAWERHAPFSCTQGFIAVPTALPETPALAVEKV